MTDQTLEITTANGSPVLVRRARDGELVDAYPAGAHDRELVIDTEARPTPVELANAVAEVLRLDADCRRVVLAVPELDLASIGWAEEAGFRYVVDVETRSGAWSLMVVEPAWVIDQPQALEDIPIEE